MEQKRLCWWEQGWERMLTTILEPIEVYVIHQGVATCKIWPRFLAVWGWAWRPKDHTVSKTILKTTDGNNSSTYSVFFRKSINIRKRILLLLTFLISFHEFMIIKATIGLLMDHILFIFSYQWLCVFLLFPFLLLKQPLKSACIQCTSVYFTNFKRSLEW